MKIKLLLLLLLINQQFNTFSQDTLVHSVYFDVDKYDLKANEKVSLDDFLKKVDVPNILSIELTGHTDSDGSIAYNDKLSQNRVKTIDDYFSKLNLKATSKVEFGELKPVDDNAKDEGKANNRRVEVKIIVQLPPTIQFDDIQELYKQLEQKKQTFCIDPNRDTIIALDQGTIIAIQAGTFVNQKGCVTISAKEVYKKSDIFLENLSTTSNGKMLESGGMIYIEATNSSGIPVSPKKEMAIFLPKTDYKNDMKLFKGNRDPHEVMNWTGIDARIAPFNPMGLNYDCYDYWEMRKCGSRCSFFCRIGRIDDTFKGIGNQTQKSANKSFRSCQKSLRKNAVFYLAGRKKNLKSTVYCDSIAKLMDSYGVTNYADLQLKMNKKLMDSLGLTTLAELRAELEKQRLRAVENDIVDGKSDAQTLSYYSFQTKQMGWINCDRFANEPGKKINMLTTEIIRSDKDCKLVFDKIKSVMSPPYTDRTLYRFDNIPENAPIHLVFLRYEGKKIYLSVIETKVQEKAPEPNYKEVTLEELKEAFKQFD